MHATITVDGQEYELQITARKVINEGRTAVSMDFEDTEELMERIRDDLDSALSAIDYAAESRGYEASYESDAESRCGMENNAEEWEALADRLRELLRME